MSTPQRCIAQAQEAERLAATVSYARDRARLLRQAEEWRAKAAELEASEVAAQEPEPTQAARPRSWLGRCARVLLRPHRPRGG